MTIPVVRFQVPTMDESNPVVSGYMKFQEARARSEQADNEALQNEIIRKSMNDSLLSQHLKNEMMKARIPQVKSEVSQAQFRQDNPLLFSPGVAGQVGAQLYIRKHPEAVMTQDKINLPGGDDILMPGSTNNVYRDSGQENKGYLPEGSGAIDDRDKYISDIAAGLTAQSQKSAGLSDWMEAKKNALAWQSMPASLKSNTLAQARSFGYSYDEANRQLASGKSLDELSKQKGYGKDPSGWPLPSYAPTTSTLSRQQRSNIATAGLEAISGDLTTEIAPYAKTLPGGYSAKQLMQSIVGSKKDEEQVGRAVGAMALQQELAALRGRASGITVGAKVLHEALESTMNRFKTNGLTVTPTIYKSAQNYMDNKIQKLNRAERKAMNNIYPGESRDNNDESNISLMSRMSDDDLMKLARG